MKSSVALVLLSLSLCLGDVADVLPMVPDLDEIRIAVNQDPVVQKGHNTSNGYSLTDNWTGSTFFDNFNFDTNNDPTHGYVNFVNQSVAQSEGLISAGTPSYFGADHSKVASGRGRDSVRLESKKTFSSGLFIIDLTHMPAGCGTWPAFWTCGPSWPNYGEIDIIESVNQATQDTTTLHTSSGCDMSGVPKSSFTGNWGTGSQNNPADNCDVNAPDQYSNQGCGVVAAANTYGAPFNSAKGGVFATQWEPSMGIKMWFFSRNSIPSDIASGNPNPSGWGLPYANFVFGSNCPSSHFQNHQVIFDLTFCGDWCGGVFPTDCPGKGDCNSYVQNNPSAFTEAYFDVNYVKVYQQ